ncbi:chemotaxis protein CheA [Blastopirellula sp. JC732]|uniref:Chemotaxis protein CheA n=1 Tax=Blastopirellula sediminis TaxID=2894196 RepID=A0A9X1MRI5_9BACT|nr:chemotaxis protein CheA [Blastopirellula sediminis]MCC9604654.1 chemotaxis protein CheA [Blastopirellula sediminis]MCC9632048.1 chemotaxis protein CheA [Blastopirellula sediminis]
MTAPGQDEFFDNLLSDFLDESSQLIDRLNDNLLELDEWAKLAAEDESAILDADLVNDMFRSAHSVKGLSAMLGLPNINCLTHNVENIFDAARREELKVTSHVVEVVFKSVDLLGAMLTQLRETSSDDVPCDEMIDQIKAVLEQTGSVREQTSQADAEAFLTTSDDQPVADTSPVADETVGADAIRAEVAVLFAGVADEAEIPAKYCSIFIDETELAVDELSDVLLAIDSGVGETAEAATKTLLVTSHRIKGSAASIGLNRPARLAHVMEDILQEIRDSGGVVWGDLADALLPCVDGIRVYVQQLKQGADKTDSFEELTVDLLSAWRCRDGSDSSPTATAPAESAQAAVVTPTIAPGLDDEGGYRMELVFDQNLPLSTLKAQLLLEKVSRVGEVHRSVPCYEDLDRLEHVDSLTIDISTDETLESLYSLVDVSGVVSAKIFTREEPIKAAPTREVAPPPVQAAAPVATPAPAKVEHSAPVTPPVAEKKTLTPAAPPAKAAPVATKPAESTAAADRTKATDALAKPAETLRVDIERLDQLMNLAGQLVINRARFEQLTDGLRESLPHKSSQHKMANVCGLSGKLLQMIDGVDPATGKGQSEWNAIKSHIRMLHADLESIARENSRYATLRNRSNELHEAVHQLERVSDGIQKCVMDTRMVPIGPLFGRFKRVVRDVSRSNGKDIRLDISGEKTELDKRMIDELGDPLIHMVRNSADHGIESPEVRKAAGKPPQGTIKLDAFHRGNSIIIQVTDDGKGLDPVLILRKAIDKGIVDAAEAEKLNNQQILQLIWEPGFSTAEKITEISGRGMGMDIVRSKIENVNGVVEVDSTPGKGATFTIKLPLTMAILPSLMTRINGETFALPIESITEIVRIPRHDFQTVQGVQTASIRGRVISVVRLHELFDGEPEPQTGTIGATDATVVVIGQEGRELGLAVDDLLGEEDIVVKSMAENYENVVGLSGACIRGDGRVALILDPSAMIDAASQRRNSPIGVK